MGLTHRIIAPSVEPYNGVTGGVQFVNGVAEVDEVEHAAALRYCVGAGYHVEAIVAEVDDDEGEGDEGEGDDLPPGDEMPAKSATRAAWRAYAAAHGVDGADTKSRDELIAHFTNETEGNG